ncbi:Endonuclease, Uma2 family (restriction endonuclease fold) [Asanoa ishikariensis]|uniref:Endonuclease, Uma2 family (Restriction endonuclease fold) n=1 Tax=Asanoa ishikariensis TaxID=137265 RepID=A0A1H3KYC3_9ACTN|nr:Uma2 family endonuclease [Asanoa ishikariensis]SDY56655.1 Endonuclease, Uma2 family (restriction endonuclease fold) [Asanoa ishikariensis]
MTTPYSVDALFDMPDDGNRREIFNGSLLVTPPPPLPHAVATANLRDRLYDQAPRHLRVVEGVGVYANEHNYFIPDLVVLPQEVLKGNAPGARPYETLLVVEVVSPSNASNDLVIKRDYYARFKIPEYWIADRRDQSLTILHLGNDDRYADRAVLHPGDVWRSNFPFPLRIDPAEIF